ncbi:N-methyl-L-tryptophan oxidase, partial [uncultured Rubrobacteraceae bacterium]
ETLRRHRYRLRGLGLRGAVLAISRVGFFGARDRAVRARARAGSVARPLAHHPARPAPVGVRGPRARRLRGVLRDRTRVGPAGPVEDRRPDHRGPRRPRPGEGRHPQRRRLRRRLRGARLRLRAARPGRADGPLAPVPPGGVGASHLSVGVGHRGRRQGERRPRGPRALARRDGAGPDARPGRPPERRGRGGRHRRRDLPRR